MPDKRDIIAIFTAETEDRLTKLDKGLVELEKKPDDMDLVGELNREAHTLKGAARVFGFSEIQDIAHRIEDVFEKVAQKEVTFTSAIAERIFTGLDSIRAVLEKIVQEEKVDVDVSQVCRDLEQCTAGKSERKGKRREGGKGKKERAAQKIQREKSRPPKKKELKELQTEGEVTVEKKDEIVHPLREPEAPPSVQGEEYIRVPLSRVNKLLYLAGELVINKMKSSAKIAQAKKISKLSREALKGVFHLQEIIKKEFPFHNGEVAKFFNHYSAQIQKLTEHTLDLYDIVSTEAFHIDPVIDELQARMKEIKMLPVSTIFEGFPRMVRDIASQRGKEVNLEIFGGETELDKKVLEGIKASLMHILRNCVDHGIEDADERAALGKAACGTIKVSAFNEADNVVIVIEDDGKGIDIHQVVETALRKGLVSRDDLERMTEKEILNIVFMNGYSTSPLITDVSGRGMGLDIVMRDIGSLKGQVLLDTEVNRGTKFTLVLPLTVAIMQVLLVRIGEILLALPMLPISECIEVTMEDVSTIEGRLAIQVRGETVPLVRLSHVLELPPGEDEEGKPKDRIPAVIASSLDRRVGFLVDEIVGEEEVFIKSLGQHLGRVKNVSGASILGTGEVVVVLDVVDLIASSALKRPAVTDRRPTPRKRPNEKRILVVEDAFSTRELEKSILEARGYLVDTAVDGLDALERMTRSKYDLVISDIEMPRMDGFQLCRTFKENEEYKDIPVVMVTALEKEEHKRRGIEVGAAAYIVKSAFDQSNLLDTIERLIG
jgi:two-component system chemotaxis sensor kinase CheA